MISVCCRCNCVMGEIEPLEDKSETHGLCKDCLPQEIRMIKAMKERRRLLEGRHEEGNSASQPASESKVPSSRATRRKKVS